MLRRPAALLGRRLARCSPPARCSRDGGRVVPLVVTTACLEGAANEGQAQPAAGGGSGCAARGRGYVGAWPPRGGCGAGLRRRQRCTKNRLAARATRLALHAARNSPKVEVREVRLTAKAALIETAQLEPLRTCALHRPMHSACKQRSDFQLCAARADPATTRAPPAFTHRPRLFLVSATRNARLCLSRKRRAAWRSAATLQLLHRRRTTRMQCDAAPALLRAAAQRTTPHATPSHTPQLKAAAALLHRLW